MTGKLSKNNKKARFNWLLEIDFGMSKFLPLAEKESRHDAG
jgi:hypothetical protein